MVKDARTKQYSQTAIGKIWLFSYMILYSNVTDKDLFLFFNLTRALNHFFIAKVILFLNNEQKWT